MGLKFDRVLENVDGPLEKIADVITPAAGQLTSAQGAVGFTVPHRVNDSFKAVNRLLKAGEEVFFVGDRSFQSQDGTGVMYITAKPSTAAVLQKAAADFGLTFTGVTSRPAGALYKLTKPRIALWDQYGGSMPSGHTRWLLEQFEFDFEVVYPQTLDAGNLKAKYDVIIFPDGGIPETDNAGGGFGGRPPTPQEVPEEFRARLGRVSLARTVPQLKRFAEEGGVIVAYGGSAALGYHLGLPVSDHLVEVQQDGEDRPLPRTKYFIPGSIVRVAVDNTTPLGFGFEKQVDVFFENSPVHAAGAERGAWRREAGVVVRLEGAAAVWLGLGPALPRWRHHRRRRHARQGQGLPDRARDHLPRPAAWHLQVPVQQHLLRHRAGGRGTSRGDGRAGRKGLRS